MNKRCLASFLLVVSFAWLPNASFGQTLTGTLIGTVKDEQGGVLTGAVATVSSRELGAGPLTMVTNEKGQLRFQVLPPGTYALEISMSGFRSYREENVIIQVGATIERSVVLVLAGVAVAIDVEAGSRIEARGSGLEARFDLNYIKSIPGRRYSMFDFVKVAPGLSPTSPSGLNNNVSAFGSGVNENAFLLDGTNFTCPCSGGAIAEPGVDVIHEVQVQSVGASAEFGNIQGAVINVVTRSGGNLFRADTSYYGQMASLTAQPVTLPCANCSQPTSGYVRSRYRDFTINAGGPIVRNRAWFYAGYQYLRDADSQPGTDPKFPGSYATDKVLGKLTWQMTPTLRLQSSLNDEFWVSPERPSIVLPFEATSRFSGTIPTSTFAHVTHTPSSNTVWEARVGRFVSRQTSEPSIGNVTTTSRFDNVTGLWSGSAPDFGEFTLRRTTVKGTVTHYRAAFLWADHEWKAGGQAEKGQHDALNAIPTGVRYVDRSGQPFRSISREPATPGGQFITVGAFASDAMTLGDRLTVNLGIRFDHTRAISPDFAARDVTGRETDETVEGLGTLYTWNVWSPRLGLTTKLTSDGRTILRSSYGRFHQGVLTGELSPVHPGQTPTTTMEFNQATGGYTTLVSVADSRLNLRLDPATRTPRTDEFSIGIDREIGRRLSATVAYVRKDGTDFIGWIDTGGVYRDETRTLADGRVMPVSALTNGTAARRFMLTNPAEYSLTYNGVVTAVQKRPSDVWQLYASYTWSRTSGVQPSSGGAAGDDQLSSTLGGGTFGRDPNSLTNAGGRLPNDRPHMFRVATSWSVFSTGFLVATNVQYLSGKPWAATAQVSPLPQGAQRVLLEPRGSRRLPSQAIVDFRVSRPVPCGSVGRLELLFDVLNLLNRPTVAGIATDNYFSPNFERGTVYITPRRVMLGARLNLGR
jgi:hypothetical protein